MKFSIPLLSVLFGLSCGAQAQTTPISAVQGASDASPLVGQTVTVEGVVTGDFQLPAQFSGFFLQDANGDNNPTTSDGIFVYVNARSKAASVDVKVGDLVRVTGRVEEFGGQTQIGRTSQIEILGSQTPLASTPITLPLPTGTSFERYEGMTVTFPQKLTVTEQGQLARYGALTLSLGRLFVPTNLAPLGQIEDDGAQRSLVLDDASGAQSPNPVPYLDENGTRRAGSTLENATGILSFDYEKYRLQPTIPPVFADENPRPTAPPQVGGTLKIGAANVHNYWTTLQNAANPDARGAKTPAQFARQSANTIAELKGLDADVLGLMELENNGETSIDDLLKKLNAAYGSAIYARVPDVAGAITPGPIKVGIIYKTASVKPRGAPISFKDGIFDRYPLAQTFTAKNGAIFSLVVNHFKSKGSGPETGDTDKGEGAWNQKRVKQAEKLLGFIKQLQVSSGDADVLSLGDYNAYTEEAPILALRSGGLEHLNLRLAPEERYSFGFNGRYGSLDHAFATPSMAKQVMGFAEWHINADEPYFLDYPYVRIADFQVSPFRASDHDPLLIGLDLKIDKAKVVTKKATIRTPAAKKNVPRKKAAPKKTIRKKRRI